MQEEIVNKVAQSGITTLDAEEWLSGVEPLYFDLKPFLFQEFILREKDFRAALKVFDFSPFQNQVVCLYCSNEEAIIQQWAWMLATTYLLENNATILSCEPKNWQKTYIQSKVNSLNINQFTDARLVVKGCGNIDLDKDYYIEVTKKLKPVVKALMFGEPCSTVPVFKKR